MTRVEGFTVFDWGKVIENAYEVWTMDTSITLMMELLDCSKIDRMTVYCRHKNLRTIKYLYPRNRNKWGFLRLIDWQ